MKLSLASIHIHPIKSLGGFAVEEARLTDRGLEHDRRWMLVDEQGVFITQREMPAMATLHTSPIAGGFRVNDATGGHIDIPHALEEGEPVRAQVWSDRVKALLAAEETNEWFTEALRCPARMVYMPDASKRRTDGRYASGSNSLSDGFPYLIVSQASLDDLNEKLRRNGATPVPMDRFRPNLVIVGGDAFQEDQWREITIGDVEFKLVKPCARCVIVTTDQRTGSREKEPLRTLAEYRRKGSKVLFAMNAVAAGGGTLRVGDPVSVRHLRGHGVD
jgi:uncharacterized protein